jgi:hypothetical protein
VQGSACMRRGLAVVGAALAGVLVFKSLVAPSGTLMPTKGQSSVFGLHIAHTDNMKSFPPELVPIP